MAFPEDGMTLLRRNSARLSGLWLVTALLLTVLNLSACRKTESTTQASIPTKDTADCVENYDPTVDYFPEKPKLHYAERFSVEYFRHYKVVTVDLPESTAHYVLVRCGTPPPEGVEGTLVEVPVQRVVTLATVLLPHLEDLDLLDHLVGHDELDYVSSQEVRRRMTVGSIAEVGEGFRINMEVVLNLEPDLILAATLASDSNSSFARLAEEGIVIAHVPSFLETSPLGRAEWSLFTALFFNAEAEAAELFGEVAQRYEELAALGRAEEEGPRVFASGPEGDAWYVPGGQSFMAQLIADAGGRYLWAENKSSGSLPLALESVFDKTLDAEIWLHPSHWRSRDQIAAINPLFTRLSAFREERIYQNDARFQATADPSLGANDYWEMGTARPDLVLADFLSIFHPELVPDHELFFHRRLP